MADLLSRPEGTARLAQMPHKPDNRDTPVRGLHCLPAGPAPPVCVPTVNQLPLPGQQEDGLLAAGPEAAEPAARFSRTKAMCQLLAQDTETGPKVTRRAVATCHPGTPSAHLTILQISPPASWLLLEGLRMGEEGNCGYGGPMGGQNTHMGQAREMWGSPGPTPVAQCPSLCIMTAQGCAAESSPRRAHRRRREGCSLARAWGKLTEHSPQW